MKKFFKKIVDTFRKSKIFKIAAKKGCDIDGDVIIYKKLDIMSTFLLKS